MAEKPRELFGIVETLTQSSATETAADQDHRPIWETIEEISHQALPEAWDDVPTDSSISVDRYFYRVPKQ